MKIIIIYYFCTYISTLSAATFRNSKYRGLALPFISKDIENIYFPTENFFSQKLDHFNPTDETLWLQKYWKYTKFYKPNGPAFLIINGEAPADPIWNTNSRWSLYAEENNAIIFLLEHRFYGESRPTGDTSTDNLKHLNSEQALADAAYFIQGMNKMYNFSSEIKWIAFGGSYAGSLAAWLRLKYPHLVYGAVSSSGPLFAKVDFFEYYQTVSNSISSYNKKCVETIKEANTQLDILVKTYRGRAKIKGLFKLCSKLKNKKNDISSLFEYLAANFALVVQYNKDNCKIVDGKFYTIDDLCNIMDSTKYRNNLSALSRYAEVNKLMLQAFNYTCTAYKYEYYIEWLKKTDWKSESNKMGGRSWYYQTCTEFGFYQTSSKYSDVFGSHFPVEYYINQCKDVFGSKFNESLLNDAVNRTNIIYGGLDINVGNIIYVYGSIDPWHTLGIVNTNIKNAEYQTVFISGSAHCADLYPPSSEDSKELKEAVEKIRLVIRSWLHSKK